MLPVPRFTPTVRKSRPQPISLMEGLKKVQVWSLLLCSLPVQHGPAVHASTAPVCTSRLLPGVCGSICPKMAHMYWPCAVAAEQVQRVKCVDAHKTRECVG